MIAVTALAVFALQGSIFVSFIVASQRGNVAAAINSLGALVLAILPILVQRSFHDVVFGPVLLIWLASAGFLHSLGMLGLYESTGWWDHITHTVSAGFVAALIYALVSVSPPGTTGIGRSTETIAIVTVVFTFVIGVFWELIELVAREIGERYDFKPVLVHYGWRDTALDLGFDIVGALLVIAVNPRVFVPLGERFSVTAGAILLASGWLIFGGSLLIILFLGFNHYDLRQLIFQ